MSVTYIYNIIVKEEPEAVTLDYADVMASVWAWPTVHHNCHQVIESLWVESIIRLKVKHQEVIRVAETSHLRSLCNASTGV